MIQAVFTAPLSIGVVMRCQWLIGLTTVVVGVSLCGCDEKMKDMDKTVIDGKIDVVLRCQTTRDLELFFAKHSLDGKVQINTEGSLVFVQSFPYSGVDASHLYVYAQDVTKLTFVCFFRVPTQDAVNLSLNEDGSVEIRIHDKRLAVLDGIRFIDANRQN